MVKMYHLDEFSESAQSTLVFVAGGKQRYVVAVQGQEPALRRELGVTPLLTFACVTCGIKFLL